jgi:hypothetical protein
MKDFAALLQGIAAAAWPVVALIALFLFKGEVKALMSRLKRGKILGQEIELSDALATFEKRVEVTRAALPEPSDTPTSVAVVPLRSSDETILGEAAKSPKTALMLLAASLERELREILAVTGAHSGRFNLPAKQIVRTLAERGMIPENLSGTIDSFWQIRNRVVHGSAASDDDILRALDSGLSLLDLLRAIPRETYVVHHPGVDVYADADGKALRDGVRAVILETRARGQPVRAFRAFPTTRSHFAPGKAVAWEWNPQRTFGESWYRDPDSGEIKYGWTSSLEFVGRLLDDL